MGSAPWILSVNRANDTLSDLRCAPHPAELFIDIASFGDDYDGLPGEGLIRSCGWDWPQPPAAAGRVAAAQAQKILLRMWRGTPRGGAANSR